MPATGLPAATKAAPYKHRDSYLVKVVGEGRSMVVVLRFKPEEGLPFANTSSEYWRRKIDETNSVASPSSRELSRMLLVCGLPGDVDEEDVADFFEHKRRGGFAVDKVKLDQAAAKAVVFFQEAKAVETILQMGPLMMHKVKLDVHRYDPSTDSEEGCQGGSRTLLVAGLPAGLDRGRVQDYFESRRRGGFTVDKVELRPGGRTALVHFQEAEAVDAILKKTPHVLKKTTLNICACTSEMEEEFRAQPQDDDTAVSGKDTSLILQVTGLPDPVDEEFLTIFFESRKVSGGYGVERVELQHSALVYFEDPEAVKTVLQRAPHLMKKKQISVSAYTEPPKNRGQRKKEKAKKEEEEREQEKEEGSCTVAVRGYGSTSVETLEMYFENSRKSGGEDVQSCTEDEKEKVIYVTFQSPQVAKRVSEKSGHTVGSRKLSVSLHRARPSCPDRVFLSGVPVFVSKESLVNFLVARTKLSVRDVLYGEEEDTALVTFGEKYDLGTLEKALKQRKLEGFEVKARPVAVSDTVLVRGVSPSVSKGTLELYFDNTRKSGGEDVQGVEKLGEETWLVTFADYQVASRVCERTHHLGGAKLQLSLYMDCLGPEGGDPDPWSFPLPPPLSVPVPQPFLLRFLRENPSQGQALKEMLAQRHAQARLDDVTALMVTCTLTRETLQGKRLAKTWTEDVQTAVRDFLGGFKVEPIRMSPTIFAEMAKDANRFQSAGDGAAVYIEKKTFTIVVVGCPPATSPLIKAIEAAKEHHEAELERRRQTVESTVTVLQPHQLQFLSYIAFPQKAMQNAQDLEVTIDISKGEVKFKGLFNVVRSVQVKMFELAQNLWSHRLILSSSQGSILKIGKVQEFLRKRLQNEGLVAVWKLTYRELTLWAATDQDVVQAAHVFKAAVQERTLNLDPESVALLSSKDWGRKKKEQEGREGLMIITANPTRGEINVTSLEELLAPALEEIYTFLNENTLYKAKLHFPPGRQRFLTEHLSSKVYDLQNNNRAYHVRITIGKEFQLEGNKEGLRRVVEELRALGTSIKSQPHKVDDSAMVTFLNSPRGKEVIVLTQKDARCVILEQDDKTDQPTIEGALGKHHTASAGDGYQVTPGVNLFVTKGDITAMKVDAIVNAANEKLQHYGGLAHAINQKAGPGLQAECNAYCRHHGPLREGQMMVSGPGALPCQKVIHAVGPRYHGGQSGEEARLKEAIKGSLEAAHSLRLGSIAMPAISSDIFGYPVREVAQVIVEAIKEFFESNPSSSLREVHLVNGSPDIVQHFHRAAAKCLTSTQPKESTGKSDKKSAEVNTFTLFFFSDNATEIQRALMIINEKYSSKLMERSIAEDTIKTLTPEQLQELEKQLRQHKVTVHVDQSKGEVHIKGHPSSIIGAMNSAQTLLRNIDKERQEAAAAEILSSYVEWGFLAPDGNLQVFDKLTGANIEKAFKNQSKKHTFVDAKGVEKVLEFDKMEMYTAATMGDKMQVIRRDLLQKASSTMQMGGATYPVQPQSYPGGHGYGYHPSYDQATTSGLANPNYVNTDL